jgi:hypothetical protein
VVDKDRPFGQAGQNAVIAIDDRPQIIVIAMSTPAAAAFGVAAFWPLCWATQRSAFSAERFQTVT